MLFVRLFQITFEAVLVCFLLSPKTFLCPADEHLARFGSQLKDYSSDGSVIQILLFQLWALIIQVLLFQLWALIFHLLIELYLWRAIEILLFCHLYKNYSNFRFDSIKSALLIYERDWSRLQGSKRKENIHSRNHFGKRVILAPT
jgi:hypothetical protein